MHNYYTHLYNKAVFDLLQDVRGEGEAVLFARSATAGGERWTRRDSSLKESRASACNSRSSAQSMSSTTATFPS